MSGQKCVCVQTCVGTNVCGHKRVWAQSCVGTIVCEHNRVLAQTCVGTNVSGHNRVGSSMYGHKRMVSKFNDNFVCNMIYPHKNELTHSDRMYETTL